MNLLIIGSLLALAVVALLGAVLLGMGEERAEQARREERAALSVPALPAPQVSPAPESTFPSPIPVKDQVTRTLTPELPAQAPAAPQIAATPPLALPQIAATPSAVVMPPPPSTPPTLEAVQEPEITLPSVPLAAYQANGPLATSPREHGLLSAYKNGHVPVSRGDERLAIRTSQIREIAGELRALAQKANELELRLSSLEEVLEGPQSHQDEPTDKHRAIRPESSSF